MAQIKFSGSLETSNPRTRPVTIIGLLEHLQGIPFDVIKTKLEPWVSDEVFQNAIQNLSKTDSCPLYLNLANIAVLPKIISRNNTPSNAHKITQIAQKFSNKVDEYFVIICEKENIFASACGLARAFPLFTQKSSEKSNGHNITVEFITPNNPTENVLSAEDIALLDNGTFAVRNAAKIVDIPCSVMNTDQLVRECEIIAKELGITPVIIRGEELRKLGMGGIYGVGKAAEHPPALVVLSHRKDGAKYNVAWVGKGIVFDTGGLSIKGKAGIQNMKRDCGGAAAILNAFYLAVKGGFQENLHAILCIAENAVGPLSTRPDDILTMYSGKTVEVNNTDAEGRLVLADGVAYAKRNLSADIIVDMATLTGAQGIATGKYHAAVLTNTEEWEKASVEAGKNSGDLTFPLVFAPEFHFPEFQSDIADMKNHVAQPGNNAPSACAGLFILSHLDDFPGTWLHVDIASPSHVGDRGTGFGVAFLNCLFGNMSSNSMLKSLSPWSVE